MAAAAPPPEASAIEEARQAFSRRDCGPALALGEPAPALPPRLRQLQLELRLVCLITAGRLAEADAVYPTVVAGPLLQPRLVLYGIERAMTANDPAKAADLLIALAGRSSPVLAELPSTLWRVINSELTARTDGARRDRLSLALARIVWQPADGADVRDALAAGAIRALARDGRADEAAPFVEQLESPAQLARYAALRSYASLWPAVEARLGPAATRAIDRFAAAKLEASALQPQIPSIRWDAVQALLLLNRPADAARLAETVTVGADIAYEDAQTIILGARAQRLAGDEAGGIARLRAFVDRGTAGVDPGNVAAAVPVLSTMLVDAGRPQEALDLVRDTLTRQAGSFSGWGIAQLKVEEVCALAGLGRRDEAKGLAERLATDRLETMLFGIEAWLCMGDTARATALLRTALANEEGAQLLVDDLQPAGARLTQPAGARMKLWSDFAVRPEVRAVAATTMRVLPPALWPTRAERPLPRAALTAAPTS